MTKKIKNTKNTGNLQRGFQDIKTVCQEGNLKLFLKQCIAVLLVFMLFRYLSGQFASQTQNYQTQMEAIRMQKKSESSYLTNKEQLLSLEPRFPDISAKNEWLMSQVLGIFKEAGLAPDVSGSQSEDASNPSYVATSLQVNSVMGFDKFAEFLAGIENREEFVKVSDISVEKNTDREKLGSNRVTMKFNTVFPKEKIAKVLFKDNSRRSAPASKRKGEAK